MFYVLEINTLIVILGRDIFRQMLSLSHNILGEGDGGETQEGMKYSRREREDAVM